MTETERVTDDWRNTVLTGPERDRILNLSDGSWKGVMEDVAIAQAKRTWLVRAAAARAPIPMLLCCPDCGAQHVDQATEEWDNPPHKSHLCHSCGNIWRPADVPTVGVAAIETKGQADTWTPDTHAHAIAFEKERRVVLEADIDAARAEARALRDGIAKSLDVILYNYAGEALYAAVAKLRDALASEEVR